MIEVEAKIKILDPKKYRKLAKTLAKYIGKETKKDTYYSLENLKKYPEKSLRIRKRENFFEVNFKKQVSYANGTHAKIEDEFKVSDIRHFLSLIHNFGFKPWIKKDKITELYEVEKNLHIEINHVKKLGWFLEIECLCHKKDITTARKKVAKLIKALKINPKQIIKAGYTKQLWDKTHKS